MRSRITVLKIGFFILLFSFLFAPIKIPFNLYDEGISVTNAVRMMKGDVPFKDFWTIYPPGQYFTLSGLFTVFGTNLMVARLYDTLVRFALVWLLYRMAGTFTTEPLAMLIGTVGTLWLASAGSYAYSVFPALALGLWAILCLYLYTKTNRKRWLLFSGILIGLESLFRWDLGLYTGLSITLSIFSFPFLRTMHPGNSFRQTLKMSAEMLLLLLGAVFLVIIPWYCFWAITGGIGDMWFQVVTFPVTMLHDVRWKPYPPLLPPLSVTAMDLSASTDSRPEIIKWIQFYAPLAIYSTVLMNGCIALLRKCLFLYPASILKIALTSFGILLFFQAMSRYDYIHTVPTSLLTILMGIPLLFSYLSRLGNGFKIRRRDNHGSGPYEAKEIRLAILPRHRITISKKVYLQYPLLLLGFVSISIYYLSPINNYSVFPLTFPWGCYSSVARASCVLLKSDQEKAVLFIQANTSPEEYIYVGNTRHDRIYINDVGFYFLSERRSATKFSELHPGIATTQIVQELIVRDLTLKNVRWVVLLNRAGSQEPNESALSSGIFVLDQYIQSAYKPVREFGAYAIWKRLES
jgi:hypothetical protein